MKKCLLIAIIAAALLMLICAVAVRAETDDHPRIIYTIYNGHYLAGIASVPGGGYWARITLYVDGNAYVRVYAPIGADGIFRVWIYSACNYITAAVVEGPEGEGEILDAVEEFPVYGE